MMTCILIILDLLFVLFFVGSFCEFKNKYFVGFCIVLFTSFEYMIEMHVDIHYHMYILIFMDLFFSLLVFKNLRIKIILCFIMAYFIFVASKFLSTLCLEATFIIPSLMESTTYELALRLFLTQVIQYLLGILLIRYYHKNNEVKWIFVTLIPIFILLIITVPNHKYWYELLQNQELFSFTMTMLVCIVFAFLFQSLLMYNTRTKRELEKEKLEHEFLERKFEMMNNQYRTNFDFLHSMLHEVTALNENLDSKDFLLFERSAKKLQNTVYETFNAYYTNNIALSVVLNTYKIRLKDMNIVVHANVYSDLFSNISLLEQVELYSELFEIIVANIKENSILLINGEANAIQDILKVEFESEDMIKDKIEVFQFIDYEGNKLKGLIIKNK